MPLNIRDREVERLAEAVARARRVTKTEAFRAALASELGRIEKATRLRDRLKPLQARILARPATGLAADKAFFDEISGKE